MTLWAIKTSNGFLKGNGTAASLVWRKEAYKGALYKTMNGANKVIERLRKRRSPVEAEVCEVEIKVHGTINEIIEREVLSED